MEISKLEAAESWQDLLQDKPCDHEFEMALRELEQDTELRRKVESALRLLQRGLPSSVVFRVLSSFQFEDILALWRDQWMKARDHQETTRPLIHRPFQPKGWTRRHHQLLCTEKSLLRRLDRVNLSLPEGGTVLLIGDDDQLSCLLALDPRYQVTVVDIDPELIEGIQSTGLPLTACVHDLSQQVPPDLQAHYDLIVMDPPYSVEGLKLFIEGARRFLKPESDPQWHVYVASLCLGREELQSMSRKLREFSLTPQRIEPGVCQYVYPSWMFRGFRTLLWGAALILRRPKWTARLHLIPNAISSDLWVLASAESKSRQRI